MPTIIEQPKLMHPRLSELSTTTGAALIALTGILEAPADQPNLATVITNVLRCLEAVQVRAPHAANALGGLTRELLVAGQSLAAVVEFDQPAAMSGRLVTHRAWALFSLSFDMAPAALLDCLGFVFARAYLTQGVFPRRHLIELYRLQQQAIRSQLTQTEEDWLENHALMQAHRTVHIFVDRVAGLDAKTAALNAQVVASINAQTSSLRLDQRQAAGLILELTDVELEHVTNELRIRIQGGDGQALQIALAYCIGLSWELSNHIPFHTGARCPTVAWINPVEGCIYVDLERVFPGLSKKNSEQHVETTLLLVRPLPFLVADAVRAACAANPGLEAIVDLGSGTRLKSHWRVPGTESDAAIKTSIARFIASRGGAALRAGLPRDLAAYASLSLSLISKSDHPYLIKRRADIWRGCEQVYMHLGWGPCVSDPAQGAVAFGSRVTPKIQWVKAVIAELSESAAELRPGKRYGLSAVIQHHNAFGKYVSLLMTILVGGRGRKSVEFSGSVWREDHAFGQHGDKLAGPTKGLTPLPIPATLAMQIRLWHIHLIVLDRRLEKLNFKPDDPARERIHAIANGNDVNLMFRLDDEGTPQNLATALVFKGAGELLNRDFSRHLLTDLLEVQGVPFDYIQCWLRHHVDGLAASATTSNVVQQVWLSNVAAALDRIALNLGLRPVHGIAKGV